MNALLRRLGIVILVGVLAFGPLASSATAQRPTTSAVFRPSIAISPFNPFYRISPTMTIGQYAGNIALLGQAYQNVPAYALGYNPYPQVISSGPVYPPYNSYGPFYGGGYGGNPYLTTTPYGGAGTAAMSTYGTGTSALETGYNPGYYGNPYVPYYDPLSGFLRGAADLTSANANYQLTMQRARLSQQQVYQAMIETRHKMFEERRYEQMHTPNAQDIYEATQALDLRRAQKDPPAAELYSGRPLNALLRHLQSSLKGPVQSLPLDEDVLKRINVRVPGTRGNFGMLRDDGKIQWPMALRGNEYGDSRKDLEKYLPEAVNQIKFNPAVDQSLLKDVNNDLKRMNDTLLASVADIPPSQFIEARRFLNQLEDAVKALEDPKAGTAYQDWKAKGHNAAELVKYMKDKGLEFAPATPGDEYAYQALYQALRALDVSILDTAKK
jgi:hypothetical protein